MKLFKNGFLLYVHQCREIRAAYTSFTLNRCSKQSQTHISPLSTQRVPSRKENSGDPVEWTFQRKKRKFTSVVAINHSSITLPVFWVYVARPLLTQRVPSQEENSGDTLKWTFQQKNRKLISLISIDHWVIALLEFWSYVFLPLLTQRVPSQGENGGGTSKWTFQHEMCKVSSVMPTEYPVFYIMYFWGYNRS